MKKFILSLGCLCSFVFASATLPTAETVVLPKPASITIQDGSFQIGNVLTAHLKKAKNVNAYLKQELKNNFGVELKSSSKNPGLLIDVNPKADISPEGYSLNITKDGIQILASTEAGAFYGVQSLLQLMKAGKNGNTFQLACQQVQDAPRFSWRSFMLDEARYFHGEDEVYKLLDVMAELKMNVFHWHLTDDAGWRIEIKKYPLLTEVGGKRRDTQIGGWNSEETMGKAHEGFYTQAQVKKILAYAKERHIKVVPEIEMPGHASAAIAAYPWLGTKNEQIEVPVKFGKHYHTFNVIDPKVKGFLKDVVAEVIDLFDTDVIHIGGDEVRFTHWEEDMAMNTYKNEKGFNSFMDIQIEFTNEMSRFIEKKGCSMMGWNEILGKNLHASDNISFAETSTSVAPNVVVQYWSGDIKDLAKAAEKGYKLVNSHTSATYLDYGHNQITLKSAYSFNPIPKGMPKEAEKNIVGLGCQMWGEWTPTIQRVHEQTFPRIAALAEVGWTDLDNKNYDCFVKRLKPLTEEWKERGITVYSYAELD